MIETFGCKDALKKTFFLHFKALLGLFFDFALFDVLSFDAIAAPIFLGVVLLFPLDDLFHRAFVFDASVSLRNLFNSVELLSNQLTAF